MPANDNPPVSLRIRLKYPTVERFIEKYAPNISRGGMFIQSRAPQPVGTRLRFEVLLKGGTRLLKGEGRVVWVKEYDAAQPGEAHGMGVRFTSLDGASEQMIHRVLDHRAPDGRQRRSPTQEMQRLASAARPADADEPAQTALGTSLGGAIQLSEDLRIILGDADRQLEEIVLEAGLAPAGIEETLRAASSHPGNGSDISGLNELLAPLDLEPMDRGGGLEGLRRLLGAAPVRTVAPLTVSPPLRRPAAAAEPAAAEPAAAEPAAAEPAAVEPEPPTGSSMDEPRGEARASSPDGPTAIDIALEPLPATQDSSADLEGDADFDLDIEAAIEPADPPEPIDRPDLDPSLIEAAVHLPGADDEQPRRFDLSEDARGADEPDSQVLDLPPDDEVIFASRAPIEGQLLPDAEAPARTPPPQLIGDDQLPGDSDLPADPDLQDQVFETLAQARRMREAGLVPPPGEREPPETLDVADFAELAEVLEPAPTDYDEALSTEDHDLPSIDEDLPTRVDDGEPPSLGALTREAGPAEQAQEQAQEQAPDASPTEEKPRRSGIFRRIFGKE